MNDFSRLFSSIRDDGPFPHPTDDDSLLRRVQWALRGYYDALASMGPNGGYRGDGYINQLIAQNNLPPETIPRRYASGDDGIRVQSVEEIQQNLHRLINNYQGFQNPPMPMTFPGSREIRTLPPQDPSPQVQQYLQGGTSPWNTPKLPGGMGFTSLNQNQPALQTFFPHNAVMNPPQGESPSLMGWTQHSTSPHGPVDRPSHYEISPLRQGIEQAARDMAAAETEYRLLYQQQQLEKMKQMSFPSPPGIGLSTPLINSRPDPNYNRKVGKAIVHGAKATADFLLLDTLRTYLNPESSFPEIALATVGILPIGKIFKGGKLIGVLAKSEVTVDALTKLGVHSKQITQIKNFAKSRKIDAPILIYQQPNRSIMCQAIVKGKDPGRFAIWELFLTARGERILYGKRSFYSRGQFEHWHEYFPKSMELTTPKAYLDRVLNLLKSY